MKLLEHLGLPLVRGRINVCRVYYSRKDRRNPRRVEPLFQQDNQIQIEWGAIAAQCIGLGNRNYKVNAMYIEYENVAEAGDTITPPSYERGEGVEYYHSLAMTPNRDFLRVPLLLQPSISIGDGYEDYFTPGVNGNVLTFHAQTQGTSGFNGKPFNDGVNSTIYGVALVATPVFNDPTQDLVFSRTYFATQDQTPKLASSQVGITWDIDFE